MKINFLESITFSFCSKRSDIIQFPILFSLFLPPLLYQHRWHDKFREYIFEPDASTSRPCENVPHKVLSSQILSLNDVDGPMLLVFSLMITYNCYCVDISRNAHLYLSGHLVCSLKRKKSKSIFILSNYRTGKKNETFQLRIRVENLLISHH